MEPETILAIAQEYGVDAVHPGYGFLAENADFIRACDAAGIAFIGPPADVVEALRDKIGALEKARAAGIPTVSPFAPLLCRGRVRLVAAEAQAIGYPLVSSRAAAAGAGGNALVADAGRLAEAVRRAQVESARLSTATSSCTWSAPSCPPTRSVSRSWPTGHGNLIHLGEREGSIVHSNQKIVEEAPALCLPPEQRSALLATAVRVARCSRYQNLGTVEFLVDDAGAFFFSEIKSRIQIAHTLTEMMTASIWCASRSGWRPASHWAMCRRTSSARLGHHVPRAGRRPAQRRYLPSPGRLAPCAAARRAGGARRYLSLLRGRSAAASTIRSSPR
jgi:acetyl/propionyl-CoA carboxylase alpha subunit